MPTARESSDNGFLRAPTIKDVAARAGVGTKTVSRVLNNEPNVRPQTRQRVLDAVEELNYRRNTIASSIRRRDQRTASIGLVVEDLANPFAALLTRVIQDVALHRSHLVLVGSSEGVAEREREIVGEFCSRRVDGLIIVPSGTDQSYLAAEQRHGTPVVFVDRPGRRVRADTVVSDNARGVVEAVRHLAGHGHSRIAYLGDRQSVYTAARRLSGFRSAMAEFAGGADQCHVRTGLCDSAKAHRAALDLLDQRPAPTALICGNNIITTGVLHAMQQRGVRDHTAVIGFDDLELADLLQPALTVVAQDVAALGAESARLLFERLKHPTTPYRRVTVPVRLITRGSGEIPAPTGGEGR